MKMNYSLEQDLGMIPQALPPLNEIIRKWKSTCNEDLARLCDQILNRASEREIYLFGRNEASSILLRKGIQCSGIIDDFTSQILWNDIPIVKFADITNSRAIVINCVVSNLSAEASARVRNEKGLCLLSFSDFFRSDLFSQEDLPLFSSKIHELMSWDCNAYDRLWEDLRDTTSRRHFYDIYCFRITTDPWFLRKYTYRPEEQYFEDFLDLPKHPLFIDAGAYHGETSEEFARIYKDYSQILAFEPSEINVGELFKKVSYLRNLTVYSLGLSESFDNIRFSSGLGSASKEDHEGDQEIKVIPLDSLELRQADFIKMDLEGSELKALKGAQNTITGCQSRLAIGCYHNPSDFSSVHSFVKSILPDSSVYIRHYTSGWAETVMYFIPRR